MVITSSIVVSQVVFLECAKSLSNGDNRLKISFLLSNSRFESTRYKILLFSSGFELLKSLPAIEASCNR